MTSKISSLISFYFELGFYHKDIALILKIQHDVTISLRQLKRKLHNLGLRRRKNYTDLETLSKFIQQHSSEQMHGYRWMYQKCILSGLNVRKEDVRCLLQILDPEGTLRRKKHSLHRRKYTSRGPNFCWHIDSYDKLKKYGLCINGAIDGFSRKILWLKVGPSNSDPKIIGRYFIDAVKEHGGCPMYIRGDMGTENTNVAFMQNYLRGDFVECKAFLYGRSTMNTKIESWWNILRKECCEIWTQKLRSIGEDGLFTGNYLDKSLIQFCCMKLLQDLLDGLLMVWNTHRIRPSRGDFPAGRPIQLYLFPEIEMADDCLCQVSHDNLELCNTYCAPNVTYPCDEDLFELCCLEMEQKEWTPPQNVDEALQLYLNLRPLLHLSLFHE